MKKALALVLFSLLCLNFSIDAQTKKLIIEINSIQSKEVVSLKYNSKNQLIYIEEKGPIIFREFTLKYDKNGKLAECLINRDRGEAINNSKFMYDNNEYITEEVKSSGKQLRKITEYNKIYTDNSDRLSKTTFEDGNLWEMFSYDNHNNLVKYSVHSISGKEDIVVDYSFDTKKSIFSSIESLPLWFWTLHMNNMKWCSDFLGHNNAIEATTLDSRFGTETKDITYEYDADNYPIKQYYDGVLAKEFKYKAI